MLTQNQLRSAWAPACKVPLTRVELVQGVPVNVHQRTESAVRALGLVMLAHHYTVRAGDTGAYNCRQVTGGSAQSLHSFGIALDINWNTNPYRKDNRLVTDMPVPLISDIIRIRTNSGAQVWAWGGHYKTVKDAMHFEIVCAPADLMSGIEWGSVHQPKLSMHEPSTWPLIERGDRGPAVERLHDLLAIATRAEAGYGTFGPRTDAMVRQYQSRHGLTVDGRVGRQTWTALLTQQPDVRPDEPGPVKRQSTQEC